MERIEDCISFLTGKAAQAVSRAARDRLAPHGVTPVQYAVLQVLWEHDGLNGVEIGQRLVLDSATTTGVIERLVKQGLVVRRPDPRDRRVNRLSSTSAAEMLRPVLQAEMAALNQDVRALLGADAVRLWPLLRQLAGLLPTDPERTGQ